MYKLHTEKLIQKKRAEFSESTWPRELTGAGGSGELELTLQGERGWG